MLEHLHNRRRNETTTRKKCTKPKAHHVPPFTLRRTNNVRVYLQMYLAVSEHMCFNWRPR